MKVLFLDIDGVVNSAKLGTMAGLFPIDPMAAFRVGKIELDTDCKVVLSSSWRHHPEAKEVVEKKVVKLYDVTPDGDTYYRGDEIQEWLDKHPEVTRYAVLDDDADWTHDQEPNWFITTWEEGLTDEIMEKVIAHLNAEK
jgi:CO dehydrogenase/acetyl-CoA synthase gamma subunit (corrinoid Fe-S protein)